MNKDQALTAVRETLAGARAAELARLEPIRAALDPATMPTVELPKGALQSQVNMARKARTNFLPLVLDTFSQVMKVDGFSPSQPDEGRGWRHWQRNRFDALQTGVNRSALAFGASYVTVMPGVNGPIWTPRSPLTMTALYQDPIVDEWPMLALDVDGSMVRLYDEEQVYYIGRENAPAPFVGYSSNIFAAAPASDWTFLEARPHGFGAVPIVRFRDRMLLDGEEQFGIIEPLLTIQARVDETVFGGLIAQYYTAFRQRYIAGWIPKSEQEMLEAAANTVWTFKDPNTKVGDLSETNLTQYVDGKNAAKLDMAAIAQVSPGALGTQGISNVSGAVMDGLQTGQDRRAAEMTTSLGESYEQLFRASAHMVGDEQGAQDFSAEVRWKNTVAVSLAQATDALGKWVAQLGVNDKIARGFLPGWTDQMESENDRLGPSVQPDSTDAAMQALLSNIDRQATTG